MDVLTSVAYILAIILLYIAIWLMYRPLLIVAKLLGNAVIGCILLLVFNLIGGLTGFGIGVNFITSAVVGIMGLPGLGLLLFLKAL